MPLSTKYFKLNGRLVETPLELYKIIHKSIDYIRNWSEEMSTFYKRDVNIPNIEITL